PEQLYRDGSGSKSPEQLYRDGGGSNTGKSSEQLYRDDSDSSNTEYPQSEQNPVLADITDQHSNITQHKVKLVDFKVGDLVRVSVSKINRFGTNRPALPCKIIEKVGEQYRLECKFGILNVCYSSGELEALGTTIYPELDKIPSDKLSVQEVARLQSIMTEVRQVTTEAPQVIDRQ
ncbi:3590_t:CDS:2, partial [Ambispora leptoticha]